MSAVAVPSTVKFTVSAAAVEPVRVKVKLPGSAGSPAAGSVAVTVTVASSSVILAVAEDGCPTV